MTDAQIVEVGSRGRVVIPAAIRRRLGIEQESQLVALVDGRAVVFLPRDEIEERLHAMFQGVPVSMSDELVAERR